MKKLEKLIGNTPLYQALNIMKQYNLYANLYLKVEKYNLTGSVKDRLVFWIIKDALNHGLINQDTTIIEATSGNTGISLSAICAHLKIKCIIVMPDSASIERAQMMEAYGAQIIYTDKTLGMQGAINEADKLKKQYANSFSLNQFDNPIGIVAHYESTGPEIYRDLQQKVDILIAGIGTGTTFTGCAKYLKEQNQTIKCIGVEPAESNVLKGGSKGAHIIEGIGAGFVPNVLDTTLIDEVIEIKGSDAYRYAKELAYTEGLLCGVSSGAALFAGIIEASKPENKDRNIVVILPDSGDRYFSKGVFKNETITN